MPDINAQQADDLLTISSILPGHCYTVVDEGAADPHFRGATVLGCARHLDYRAVTVAGVHTDWIGAPWGYEDGDARFRWIDRATVMNVGRE